MSVDLTQQAFAFLLSFFNQSLVEDRKPGAAIGDRGTIPASTRLATVSPSSMVFAVSAGLLRTYLGYWPIPDAQITDAERVVRRWSVSRELKYVFRSRKD